MPAAMPRALRSSMAPTRSLSDPSFSDPSFSEAPVNELPSSGCVVGGAPRVGSAMPSVVSRWKCTVTQSLLSTLGRIARVRLEEALWRVRAPIPEPAPMLS